MSKIQDLFKVKKIKAYILVFISIICWILFALYTTDEVIETQKRYAKLINKSGKQRMLSQKSALISKRVYETNDKKLLIHLYELMSTMKSDYKFILSNITSQAIKDIYFKAPLNLDREVKEYFSLLNKFYKNRDIKTLKLIEEFSFTLLPKLDSAVYQIEKDSNLDIQILKEREIIILIGTLITLFLEFFFIIIPLIRNFEMKQQELKELNNSLELKIEEESAKRSEQEKLLIEQSHLASMGEMIGNIAHQWRQPLNALSILMANIKNAYEHNRLDEAYIDKAMAKSWKLIDKMSTTIDDFRNFFKPDKEAKTFYLFEVVDSVLSLIEASLKSNGIEIEVNIDKDIVVSGYENEYSQVIMNLVNNAKDVLIENKIENPKISIFTKEDSEYAILVVKDNGGGIDKKIINRIFEPYFTTKEQGKGTGIGLYMSKIIIEEHLSGKISVKNSDDGAQFEIKLRLNNEKF